MMRLFIAVDVDRDTREAAWRLRADLARTQPSAERALRWVDPDNLHLTVRFLGERTHLEALATVLSPPLRQPRFTIGWGMPSWLPPRGRPRVFHVAVGEGASALRAVATEITLRLAALGIAPEDRPFTPHLTLARVRESTASGLLRRLPDLVPPMSFAPAVHVAVDALVVYESVLSPGAPSYHPRLRCAFA